MKAHEILTHYFNQKKIQNPHLSLRGASHKLDISPSYLSSVLNGKKSPSEKMLKKLIRFLDIEDLGVFRIKNSLEKSKNKRLNNDDVDYLNKYKPLDPSKNNLLTHWYYVAILDLSTIKNFNSHPKWIAQKLNLTEIEVELAIFRLIQWGLFKKIDGSLVKTDQQMHVPTKNSQKVIRNYHLQMMDLVKKHLASTDVEKQFNKRLVTSSTMAFNCEKLEYAKEKLQKTLFEISNECSAGDCDELYQLNIQFFPLT